jgi:uncharacterized protein DUF6636
VVVLVLKLALVGGLVHFQSPSGNINCIGGPAFQGSPAFVQCLVRKNSWPHLRPKPASCDLDWDPATISLGHRRVSVGSCRGDIGPLCVDNTGDRCSILPYGRSVTIGPIRCSSQTGGVTCRWRTAPHAGFLIARERYVLYRR